MRRVYGVLGVVIGHALALGCGSSGGGSSSGNGGATGAAIAMPSTSNVFIDTLSGSDQCLPRALQVTDAGTVYCLVVEAHPTGGCNCDAPGRSALPDVELRGVQFEFGLSNPGACSGASSTEPCPSLCGCSIDEEQGTARTACEADPVAAARDPSVPPGFCYVDDPASPALTACPAQQKQCLLFVSPSEAPTPAPSVPLYLVCRGAPVTH